MHTAPKTKAKFVSLLAGIFLFLYCTPHGSKKVVHVTIVKHETYGYCLSKDTLIIQGNHIEVVRTVTPLNYRLEMRYSYKTNKENTFFEDYGLSFIKSNQDTCYLCEVGNNEVKMPIKVCYDVDNQRFVANRYGKGENEYYVNWEYYQVDSIRCLTCPEYDNLIVGQSLYFEL